MRKESFKYKKDIWICSVITVLTFIFIMNFRFVRVSGDSMEPTYSDAQILFTTTHVSNLKCNDIVIFQYENQKCVKRIVAVGGDTVLLKNGQVIINQVTYNDYEYSGEEKHYTLANDEIFVLGDNTKVSIDSRNFGPISIEMIQFKIISFS